MHGDDEISCEKYFCDDHLQNWVETSDGRVVAVCDECANALMSSEEWIFDTDDGVFRSATNEHVGDA